MRIIESERDIEEGTAALVAACPYLATVHAVTGRPPLRRRRGGFEGLSRIVTGQQLSIASAGAIWTRLQAAVRPFDPATFLAAPERSLRGAGLSAGKQATLQALATAVQERSIDLDAMETAAEERIHQTLTGVKGIGPWTADIYMMFCLGRADAWSPGDLALQQAVKQALSLAARPGSGDMRTIAERWRPWRGVAARMLWSYYAARRTPAAPPPADPRNLREAE
jgi:DNA-3-methyladenine glycosylase II